MKNPLHVLACSFLIMLFVSANAVAQEASKEKELYNQLKSFSLTGDVMEVKSVVLKRGRAQISLDGTVYLSQPVDGHVTGAVFIGEGKFVAEPPNDEFEKANVKRLLGTHRSEEHTSELQSH